MSITRLNQWPVEECPKCNTDCETCGCPRSNLQFLVRQFMEAFQSPLPEGECLPEGHTFALGVNLIQEEFNELQDAQTITDRKDALGDLLYVVYWMANAHGFDMGPITTAIHESNMTKMWTDAEVENLPAHFTIKHSLPGGERRHVVVRPDGKIIKSPSYQKVKL